MLEILLAFLWSQRKFPLLGRKQKNILTEALSLKKYKAKSMSMGVYDNNKSE